MATNVASDLTLLDQSINLGQTCDIVHVYDWKMHGGESELYRGSYTVTLNGSRHLTKETFAFSKCLILVVLDYIPTSEVMMLGKRLQLFKPLALFYYKRKNSCDNDEILNVPFAVILSCGGGEFNMFQCGTV